MTGDPTTAPVLTYRPSEKHCEPMGEKRVATRHGLAFVAQFGNDGTWHGYPESWDKIDGAIRSRWLAEGRIRRRDLRHWASRDDIRNAWRELNDAE